MTDDLVKIRAYPNPFQSQVTIDYVVEKNFDRLHMELYDVLGRLVEEVQLTSSIGSVELRPNDPAEVYFVAFRVDDELSEAVKVIKGW